MDQAHLQNKWLDLSPDEWTVDSARQLVDQINDDEWKVEAVLATQVNDAAAQLVLLDGALQSSDRLLDGGLGNTLRQLVLDQSSSDNTKELLEVGQEDGLKRIRQRRAILHLTDKTKTWQDLHGSTASAVASTSALNTKQESEDSQDEDDEPSWQFEDDLDEEEETQDESDIDLQSDAKASSIHPTQLSLPAFLSTPIVQYALDVAASTDLPILQKLFEKFPWQLNRIRTRILDAIPLSEDATEYIELLPQIDHDRDCERYPSGQTWRHSQDWSEHSIVSSTLGDTPEPASVWSASELGHWYEHRIRAIDAVTGRIDNALTLAQYGASQGAPGLDALGEELSLLSRLLYDRKVESVDSDSDGLERLLGKSSQAHWTLRKWEEASPTEIVQAYLQPSTPATIANDVRRLALPYLYVLESQLERAGSPDNDIHERLFHEWLLDASHTDLDLVASIFEASKPILSPSQRLIKSDEQLARIALACLYSSSSLTKWDTMSRIFDCLPAFAENQTPKDAAQTLSSVLSPYSKTIPTARQLYKGLLSFSVSSLSRALDAFDLHLEAAEIFARWSSPVPLRFFVTLAGDPSLQHSWADRLAKTSAAAVTSQTGERLGQDFEYEDEWISLLDDLCQLTGKDQYEADEPKPAFALLSKQEITKIFFSGLLSSGKFQLAKSLFNPSSGEKPLDTGIEQELVLAASRDFYDNAESGNLHEGNMKLAFECLSVSPNTPDIRRERDFIEATSRLTSFKVVNHAGQPLLPIEIRLTPDKLSLISALLSSNEDAYRHPEVVLDLVGKLGYRGDVLAEIRVLSMLADSALLANDTQRAADVCDRMVKVVEQTRKGRDRALADAAADLAWKTCFQFGKRDEIKDVGKKKELLSRALLFCPADGMHDVLSIWQLSDITPRPMSKHASKPFKDAAITEAGAISQPGSNHSVSGRSQTPSLSSLPQSAEGAARAAVLMGRAASAYLPFRSGTPDLANRPTPANTRTHRDHVPSEGFSASGSRDTDRVREAISNRVAAGVSWLIGADDQSQ